MTLNPPSFATLSDHELLIAVRRLAEEERRATAHLIASLGELDARRLYLGEGCSSLFTYCTQVLRLSEHAAYGRIEAARAARRFPVILERLADGEMTLTTVGVLAPHLTPDNYGALIDAARHKSKREVEHVIATLRPQPLASSLIRKLPSPITGPVASQTTQSGEIVPVADPPPMPAAMPAPPPTTRPAVIRPLAPERYKVQFTVGVETFERLGRVQDLMRHRVPDGDVAAIFDRALTLLLEYLAKTKLAATVHPRGTRGTPQRSRTIPAAVRREVWARDEGRCAFVGVHGRCTERGFLEFHHVRPFAAGGAATADNIEIRCRAHNQYEAYLGASPPPVVRERAEPLTWDATRSGPSSIRETFTTSREARGAGSAC